MITPLRPLLASVLLTLFTVSVAQSPIPSVFILDGASVSPSASPSASSSTAIFTLPGPSDATPVPTVFLLPAASVPQSPAPSFFILPGPSTSPGAPPPSSNPNPSIFILPAPASSSPTPSNSGPFILNPPGVSSTPSASPAVIPSTFILPPTASASPAPSKYDKAYNVGIDLTPSGTLTSPHGPISDYSRAAGIPQNVFETYAVGARFKFSFNIPAGSYKVELGFAETSDCVLGKRVFNVFINGNLRLEAFDIFKTVGCNAALKSTFLDQIVDPLLTKPLTIELVAVADTASLSYIRITSSVNQCVPEIINKAVTADHVAHAVPGEYPPRPNSNSPKSYVDTDGDGFFNVKIDGRSSHTHLFDSNTRKSGVVTKYRWTNAETGQLVSTKGTFTFKAPLGITRFSLKVTDNGCSSDEAETTITVTGKIQPGAYCYAYSGMTSLPAPGTLTNPNMRPTFSTKVSSTDFSLPAFPGSTGPHVVRCVFFVTTVASSAMPLTVETFGTATALLYKGVDLVVDPATSKTGATVTAAGETSLELLYLSAGSTTPRVKVSINNVVPSGSAVSHDQSLVLPIISSISPTSGPVSGGTSVRINGYGLYLPLTATFGAGVSKVTSAQSSSVVLTTSPAGAGAAAVSVTTSTGLVSNSVVFTYGAGCPDSVGFTIKEMGGTQVQNPTAAQIWQDGKIYIGTRFGFVKAVTYDHTSLTITSVCSSEKLTDSKYLKDDGTFSTRSILGLAFDPRSTTPMPYVSASTLFWERQNTIAASNPSRWSNGAVVRFKPASAAIVASDPSRCLMFDKTIISGLPVSDSDHAINDVLFTQSGDLLVAVGGMTNGGLPFWKMGTTWEAKLSASIVIARLSRGAAFNGNIQYSTPTNQRTATPLTDDVTTYVTGVRNLFRMTMFRNGAIYATDMGPNCGFGNMSSSCSEYNEAVAATMDTSSKAPFPGILVTGEKATCRYGGYRKDKLLKIVEGKFYGHPNLQRGGSECQYIDPLTHLVPPPLNSGPPANYMKQVSMLESAATGLVEYGANHFCGALRGEMIISAYKGFRVLQAKLNSDGLSLERVQKIASTGGIVALEDAWGNLIYPKLIGGMPIMVPKVSTSSLSIASATPFRFGAGGGGLLTIGGNGFVNGATSVTVGGNGCSIVSVEATKIVCTVPSGVAGSSADVLVSVNSASVGLSNGVLYMNV